MLGATRPRTEANPAQNRRVPPSTFPEEGGRKPHHKKEDMGWVGGKQQQRTELPPETVETVPAVCVKDWQLKSPESAFIERLRLPEKAGFRPTLSNWHGAMLSHACTCAEGYDEVSERKHRYMIYYFF